MSRSSSILPLPRASWLARAAGAVRTFLVSVWRESQLRRDRRLLEEMDDRGLGDIGLSRGGIDDALKHGRSRLTAAEAEWSLWHSRTRG